VLRAQVLGFICFGFEVGVFWDLILGLELRFTLAIWALGLAFLCFGCEFRVFSIQL